MANVLDALKNMFVKLGGDKSKLNNNHDISDYINDIADVLKDDIEIASELPIVSTDDNGKVLGVVEGNWSKTDVPSELPAVTSDDNGKVLGVVEGNWSKTDVPSELPVVSASDNKKYLRVVSGKWQTALNAPFAYKTENYGALMPAGQLAQEIDYAIETAGAVSVCVKYKKTGSADKLFFLIGRTELGEYYFVNTSMDFATCSPNSQFTIL